MWTREEWGLILQELETTIKNGKNIKVKKRFRKWKVLQANFILYGIRSRGTINTGKPASEESLKTSITTSTSFTIKHEFEA